MIRKIQNSINREHQEKTDLEWQSAQDFNSELMDLQ